MAERKAAEAGALDDGVQVLPQQLRYEADVLAEDEVLLQDDSAVRAARVTLVELRKRRRRMRRRRRRRRRRRKDKKKKERRP
jgi:hypothetical protein